MASRPHLCTLLASVAFLMCSSSCLAQNELPSIQPIDASQLQNIDAEKMKELQKQAMEQLNARRAAAQAGKPAQVKPPTAKPATPKKPDAKKKDSGKKTPSAPGVPATITRSNEYEGTPDPKELELKPDTAGRVRFNFNGQPWLAVLQWLADTSKLTLQWKTLPGDYLNLTTQRSYTLEEARDMINQQLLPRGYTMILDGEILHVYDMKELDSATVPRVTTDDLQARQPHEFVRCSFKLEWMSAGDAVDEFTPYISKHGKLFQMAGANRLEALDMVRNLRAIQEVLAEERVKEEEEGLVQKFRIKHRRAKDVMSIVQPLMGINPDAPAQPMSSSQIKQLQKLIQNAAKTGKGNVTRPPVPTVMVLNQRENSIWVQAEPRNMKQIESIIKEVDQPGEVDSQLLGGIPRIKVYQLNTYDPELLVKTVEELGQLDPKTKLTVDRAQRAIIASASLKDHLLLDQLIKQVDGAKRSITVLQLRRLQADQVAGSIKGLMNLGDDNNSRRNYYDPWGSYYSRRSSRNSTNDAFRIEADVENNRLLLRANETELSQVLDLLRQMGEEPTTGPMTRQELIKVYQLPQDASEADLLKQMQKLWPLKNRLEIDAPKAEEKSPAVKKSVPAITGTKPTSTAFGMDKVDTTGDDVTDFFASLDEEPIAIAENPATGAPVIDEEASNKTDETVATAAGSKSEVVSASVQQSDDPPVRISVKNGRIIVTSNDPVAMEEANKLLELLMPRDAERAGGYKIFTLEHVSPVWMAIQLEDVFEIEDDSFNFWGPPPPKDDDSSLSKKKELKFITDIYTKTLMVKHATQEELDMMEDLIRIWDVPEVDEAREVRVIQAFPVKYSQANVIVDVLKEVYRDLLSGNDKALQQPGNGNGKPGGGSGPTQFFSLSSATYLTEDPEEKVKFKGLLSISPDMISNTIIVSSTQTLVDRIKEQIELLDNAARPASNMKVIKVSRNINVEKLQQRLDRLIGKPAQPKNPQQPGQSGQPKPGAQPGGQPNVSPSFNFGSSRRRRR